MKNTLGRPVNRNGYLTNRAWLGDIVGGKDLVLCYTSALEYLEFFVGYFCEEIIDVYAKQKGSDANINYRIVDSFDGVDIIKINDVFCTSMNQTVNDMLGDFDNADEQALIEGLSDYYYSNDKSFDGLVIKPENVKRFNDIKEWVIASYY